MKYKVITALCIMLMLVAVTSGYTQTNSKNGISGASILKVGVGAKAVAIGSAATTESGDVNQIFWNPAGIALEPGKMQATFSYNNWLVDLDHNAFAASRGFGKIGTFAVGAMMSGVSGIEADRDYAEGLNIDYGGGDTFDYSSMYIALAYAKQFTNKLSLGATVKYYREEIDVESVDAVAFDFGAIYRIGFRDLTLGARIQNLGGDLEYYYVPVSLPMVFSFGVSMSVIQSQTFDITGFVDATKYLDSEQLVFAGFQSSFYKNIHFRAGYKFNYSGVRDEYDERESYMKNEDEVRSHWYDVEEYYRTDEGASIGAGIDIPYAGHKMTIDYSWTAFRLLDDVNRFSFTISF
jgi:hypothetical protein